MKCPEQADVVPLEPDEVDRRMTTEACSGRNPATCDDGSVSAVEDRQERSWHGVSCSSRALERLELPGRRLAGCRPDRHTPGGDDGHERETPHAGKYDHDREVHRPRRQAPGLGQCSGMTPERPRLQLDGRGRKRPRRLLRGARIFSYASMSGTLTRSFRRTPRRADGRTGLTWFSLAPDRS